MKNHLAVQLNAARSRGVNEGLLAMCYVALASCENVLPDYIEEDKLSAAFNDMEADMARVWAEVSTDRSVEEAAEILVYRVREIREKRGMPDD